jgi:hypothetical protein
MNDRFGNDALRHPFITCISPQVLATIVWSRIKLAFKSLTCNSAICQLPDVSTNQTTTLSSRACFTENGIVSSTLATNDVEPADAFRHLPVSMSYLIIVAHKLSLLSCDIYKTVCGFMATCFTLTYEVLEFIVSWIAL